MKKTITIPESGTLAELRTQLGVPHSRKATHYRFRPKGKKEIVDRISELDNLRGLTGTIEFGKAITQGRGRHIKIVGFEPMEEPQEETPTPEPTPRKGRKGGIFGFSVCAVVKALGQVGVKVAEATDILTAYGIEMPKASVGVQLGFGRNEKSWERHGKPAPLTAEQIAELRAKVTTTKEAA